jgi:hypothetical protein
MRLRWLLEFETDYALGPISFPVVLDFVDSAYGWRRRKFRKRLYNHCTERLRQSHSSLDPLPYRQQRCHHRKCQQRGHD